jgi:hypothetical protein
MEGFRVVIDSMPKGDPLLKAKPRPGIALGFVLAVLSAAPPLRGADLMRAGQWKMVITSDKTRDPITVNRCVDAAEAREVNSRDAAAAARSLGDVDENCKVSRMKFSGNTLSYSVDCPETGLVHAQMTFGGETFEGVSKGKDTGTTHMKGRRIGDCK